MPKDARGPGTDALDQYLQEIGRHPTLSREEEAGLSRRYRETGDRGALAALVTANLRFVVAVAKGYRGRGLPLEDLINEGNLGLMRAAARFDPHRGVRLVSYASWWIRQAILAALARTVGPGGAPPPRPGREAGAPGRRRRARRRGPPPVSLQQGGGPGESGTALAERLADATAAPPDARLQRAALRRSVQAGMAFLPEREARVLRLYYGLDGGGARSLERIGRELGVSRERVRQLKARGLSRLRESPRWAELESYRARGRPPRGDSGGMKVDTPRGHG
jgi:RNA polymerase primary sigma factor